MKVVTQSTYGAPDALGLTTAPAPEAGPRDVLVAVAASVVTQGDRRLRAGDFPGLTFVPGRLALGLTGPRAAVPGTMFSGTVAAVGAEVTRFSVGDRVFGGALSGAWAERLCLPEDGPLARVPAGLSLAEAAALPYGGGTATHFLDTLGELRAGERVCVLGAAGAVGRMAVQLAAARGATVTAVCGAADAALCERLGAAKVLDYRAADYRAHGPYDLIFDTTSATTFGAARGALAEGGRLLALEVSASLLAWAAWTAVSGSRRAIVGTTFGDAAQMEKLADLAASGAMRPVLDRTFDLDDIAAAHAHLERARPKGDVVVRVSAAADRPPLRVAG